jgi:hypothetical protein
LFRCCRHCYNFQENNPSVRYSTIFQKHQRIAQLLHPLHIPLQCPGTLHPLHIVTTFQYSTSSTHRYNVQKQHSTALSPVCLYNPPDGI